jgi:hypothetical protein
MSASDLMRWSGLAAFVGGALVIVYDVGNAALFPGQHGSEVMTSSTWFIVQLLGLLGLALIALGLVGLYASQAEETGSLGLIAFVAALGGTLMLFAVVWSEAFMGPFLAEATPNVIDAEPSGAFLFGLMLSFVLPALGWLLFGLASLRASVLPRGAAVLLMVGAVLFLVLVLLDLPLSASVLGAAVLWMGYTLWSGAGEPTWTTQRAT